MSDITNTIEAPKPKRTYTRKPKVVDTIIDPVVESIIEPASEPVDKPKRKYTKKSKPTEEPEPVVVEEEVITIPPELVRATNEPAEKKPRTEKQIAAFNKMREARLKKQAELESLKEFAKEKEKFDKEAAKVEKLEEKIVAKAARKPRVKKPVEEYIPEPQPVIKQVSTYKPILFV